MSKAKYKDIIETTTDNRTYKIALKRYRALNAIISCDICPYHRHENHKPDSWRNNNWKRYRKTQYKVIMYEVCGE